MEFALRKQVRGSDPIEDRINRLENVGVHLIKCFESAMSCGTDDRILEEIFVVLFSQLFPGWQWILIWVRHRQECLCSWEGAIGLWMLWGGIGSQAAEAGL